MAVSPHRREAIPGDETIVLTITDEAGERIRRMELPAETGMQRIVWDLRHDPPLPEGTDAPGRGRSRQGAVVSPGSYVATLGRIEGERLTPLGEPQAILVVRPQN